MRVLPITQGADVLGKYEVHIAEPQTVCAHVLAASCTLVLLMHFKLRGELFCHPSQPVART